MTCAAPAGVLGMDGSSLLIVRGIVGVVIGILAVAWPGITIAALVGIFAVYAMLDGVTNLVLGLTRTPTHGRSWAEALQGVVGIAAGVLTFMWPIVTAFALVLFIGAWAVVTGIFEIAAAVRLRRIITGEWLLVLSGVMSACSCWRFRARAPSESRGCSASMRPRPASC
jgi:uncharacterized membrane protein HdeD (DUF308 family)